MDSYRKQRLEHKQQLENLFGETYPEACHRTHTCAEAKQSFASLIDTPCLLAGRILSKREHGKVIFMDIEDETEKIQTYWKIPDLPKGEGVKLLDLGDIVEVAGQLFETRTQEKTLQVRSYRLLAKALRPPPEKWHGITDVEIRFRKRYLDLLSSKDVRELFRKRNIIIRAVRKVLTQNGYLEVETPMLHPIPGGALAHPFETYHRSLNLPLFLRIAPELYLKRLLVGGLGKVFEIGRQFRNEGLDRWHNPEFTMVEFYEAYAGLERMKELCQSILQSSAEALQLPDPLPLGKHKISFSAFQTISFLDSLIQLGNLPESIRDGRESAEAAAREREIDLTGKESYGELLNLLFEETVEQKLIQPTFIVDFPRDISPLAKPKNETEAYRFELFVAGHELANAFSELNDPIQQRAIFHAQHRETGKPIDHDYLEAMEYGMPPAGGCGIGLDRLVILLTNSPSIREVLLFPLLKPAAPDPEST